MTDNPADLPTCRKLVMKATYHICKLVLHMITACLIGFPLALSIYFAVYFGQYLTGSVHSHSFSVGGGDFGDNTSAALFPIMRILISDWIMMFNSTYTGATGALPVLQ